jgi:hypothetical protein
MGPLFWSRARFLLANESEWGYFQNVKTFWKTCLIVLCTVLCSIAMAAVLRAEDAVSDDDQASSDDTELAAACTPTEHYCGHVVAMFTPDGGSAPPYKEGQCVSRDQKCSDFWCGNRHCGGWFGTQVVCCIQNGGQAAISYQCAGSELNCPGNTQQLTIRDRTLRS